MRGCSISKVLKAPAKRERERKREREKGIAHGAAWLVGLAWAGLGWPGWPRLVRAL